MKTFVRIADLGSISRAARSLRLSVAMASRHLRALEDDLGVELMRRTTRRIDLTEAGVEFLARSRALLVGVDEATAAVRPGQGAFGLVVMSLPVSLGLVQINPLLPALLEYHPRLKLDLLFDDRLVDLLADGVDLAIRAGAILPDSPSLIARKLATFNRVLCASPAFLKKHDGIHTVQALESLPCVVQGPAPTRWRFTTPTGMEVATVDGRIRTRNVFAIREATLAGLGVARLPTWIVAEDVRAKRLVRVLERAISPKVDVFGMVHRSSKNASGIRAVLEYLAAELPRRIESAVAL